jgi:TPR repeat protein
MQNRFVLLALVLAGCATTEPDLDLAEVDTGEACQEYLSTPEPAKLKICLQGAKSGVGAAEYGYGLILWNAPGKDAKPSEAIDWFRRASTHGSRLARGTLGRILTDEQSPKSFRNLMEGYAWLVVAGERAATSAVAQRLSSVELDKAENLAKDFAAQYGAYVSVE